MCACERTSAISALASKSTVSVLLGALGAAALKHSEVERDRRVADVHEMARAGDFVRRAVESDVHGVPVSERRRAIRGLSTRSKVIRRMPTDEAACSGP